MFNHAGFDIGLDYQVFGYTLLVSTVTGVLFGLFPALRATRADLATDLKERSGYSSAGRGSYSRSVLVASQVALSVVALVGAGLFVRSILNANEVNLGFDAERLGLVAFNVSDQGYNEAMGRDYQSRALAAARQTPGVLEATLSKDAPFHVATSRTVMLDGQETSATLTSVVWPGYFHTVGMPLIRGRDFNEHDTADTPLMAVVNQTAADHFWPGRDPIGRVITFFGDTRPVQVVGVVQNANYQAIAEPSQALIYLSLVQYYFPTAVVYLRTNGDPAKMAAAVKRRIQPLDPNFLLQSESVEATVLESLWAQRLSALLLSAFGLLALLLAIIGIYGVISYSVTQRTREFGVRMALGATGTEIQLTVVREAFRMVAAGVVVGLALALAFAQAVRSMLFDVGARDGMTFLVVPAILILISMLACWVPAYRATRIDPSLALRDE